LVVSEFVQPVVFPVLIAVALAIPVIVKVSVGSTVALTVTDSIVPTLALNSSLITSAESVVLILIRHVSATPAVVLLFVGLISVGT